MQEPNNFESWDTPYDIPPFQLKAWVNSIADDIVADFPGCQYQVEVICQDLDSDDIDRFHRLGDILDFNEQRRLSIIDNFEPEHLQIAPWPPREVTFNTTNNTKTTSKFENFLEKGLLLHMGNLLTWMYKKR